MATVYDPIAKDGSLNTTEATPRNIADVLAEELSGIASALTPAQLASLADVTISSPSDGQTLKYDAITQKWENANDAGGHTIENPSGTDMTQRGNLQFTGDGVSVTDDAVNGKTIVDISPDAEDISYDNTSSGLSATDVQGAIDELASGKVYVGAEITETINITNHYANYYYGVGQPFNDGILIGAIYKTGNEQYPFSLFVNLDTNDKSRLLLESANSTPLTLTYRPVYIKANLS